MNHSDSYSLTQFRQNFKNMNTNISLAKAEQDTIEAMLV